MAEFRLTAGNDTYRQPDAQQTQWDGIFGLEGNDRIAHYNGYVYGGAGDDTIERLASIHLWTRVIAEYSDSPAAIVVNLAEGWAQDGWGGRDTLINIRDINGSRHSDSILGSGNDDFLHPRGGHNTVDGAGGWDEVYFEWIRSPTGAGRPPTLADLNIEASVDGARVVLVPKFQQDYSNTFLNVESIHLPEHWGPGFAVNPADLVSPQAMARDALVAGSALRWNAGGPMGSPVTLSYSFVQQAPTSGPGATGFRAFSATEQALVRETLAGVAAIAQVNFIEVIESGSTVGQMRFGVSQQTATKGIAFLPNQPGAGDNAGDVWMDRESMSGLAPGREAYQALLHEIGHALGLRHPRNVDAGDSYTLQLLAVHDLTAMTVMSQERSRDGLFRAEWGPLDVLALRLLYGSRTVASGDTVYTLGSDWGRAQFTLVDDGGTDTLDAGTSPMGVRIDLGSNLAAASLGLTPGGQAAIGNLALAGTATIEVLIGSPFDDQLIGDGLANTIIGGAGDDWIDAGDGIDTVVFDGPRANYLVTTAQRVVYVTPRAGGSSDALRNVERLQFSDSVHSFTTNSLYALASDITASTTEELRLDGELPAPADGRPRGEVTYAVAAQPRAGTVTIDNAGRFSFSPAADAFGADFFDYRIANNGSGNTYRVFVEVQGVNDAPRGSIQLAGTALPGHTLTLTSALVDPDGLGSVVISWQRDGQAIAGAGGTSYTLSEADAGRSISARLSWTDGGGTAESMSSVPLGPGASALDGTAGSDTLAGGNGDDVLRGLDGDDLVHASRGADTLDGGAGLDVLSLAAGAAALVNLRTGTATQDGASDLISGFEGVIGSASADLFTGNDRPANPHQQDEFFRGSGGNDSIDGGTGIDRAEYLGPSSAYTLQRSPTDPMRITVTHKLGVDGSDELTSIERIRFGDVYLAFGPRAEEIARVALALWSPGIAHSTGLFAIGFSYYDNGYSYETMIGAALSYWSGTSDFDLADRLKTNVPGSAFFASDLRAAMATAGGGYAGRVAAVKMAADDPASLASVRAAGLIDNGVAADLASGLFTMVTGGG